MSSKGHKRKRNIHLGKMKMALNHLVSLKEELDGFQETEVVMEHIHALRKMLESAEKPVRKVLSL
jgi:hypothetical protein